MGKSHADRSGRRENPYLLAGEEMFGDGEEGKEGQAAPRLRNSLRGRAIDCAADD